jgi:hypothetical protein
MLTEQPALVCAVHQRLGDTNVADNDKRWQDMNPDEQAVLIRQITGVPTARKFWKAVEAKDNRFGTIGDLEIDKLSIVFKRRRIASKAILRWQKTSSKAERKFLQVSWPPLAETDSWRKNLACLALVRLSAAKNIGNAALPTCPTACIWTAMGS